MAGKSKSDSKTAEKGKDKGKGKAGGGGGGGGDDKDGAAGSSKLKPATSINVRHILVSLLPYFRIDGWHMTLLPPSLSKQNNDADQGRHTQ